LVLYKAGQPVKSGFFCNDDSLRYPYKHDTIPDSLLLAFGFSIPFCMVGINLIIISCFQLKNI